MSTFTLKLLFNPEKNRVVFAESQKEFVDILFSFLTLPIGTIIRLLNKQLSLGCLDNIYKSVENMDTKNLNTKACKIMLLDPRSAAEEFCKDLLIRADILKPGNLYKCPNFDCTKKTKLYSSVPGVNCSCGKTMDSFFSRMEEMKEEVFLKGEETYIISDDLNVFPASFSNVLTFLKRFGIGDVNMLEKHVVDINRDLLLRLLEKLLLSKTPLTDVFLEKQCPHTKKDTKREKLDPVKLEDNTEVQEDKIILKLVRDKDTKRVLFAEADHVMVDSLFSFLTYPLGLIVKLLNKRSFLGCVDNLYNSVDVLASNSDCFVSEACKKMLLSPCLCLHYDCSHQILNVKSDESFSFIKTTDCKICWQNDGTEKKCLHSYSSLLIEEINPKMPDLVKKNGGGYAKESVKFMVSDEMIIKPYSAVSAIDVVKDYKVSAHSLKMVEVAIGEAEVMNLLKACLTSSDNVLSSVFRSAKN